MLRTNEKVLNAADQACVGTEISCYHSEWGGNLEAVLLGQSPKKTSLGAVDYMGKGARANDYGVEGQLAPASLASSNMISFLRKNGSVHGGL
jgi:hypothetical protein